MLAGRISWCRVCNSTPAVIPIFGKRGFAAPQSSMGASAFPSSHALRAWSGINEMEMSFLLLLLWAPSQTPRGRAELWHREVTEDREKCHGAIPQLQWLHHPAAHLHHVLVAPRGTEREVWGFLPLLCVFTKWHQVLSCLRTYLSYAVPWCMRRCLFDSPILPCNQDLMC